MIINSVCIDNIDVVKSSILETYKGDIDFKYAGKVSYDILFSLADYYLSQERSVILDTPCAYTILLDRGTALCTKYNADYKYIECYLESKEEIELRLKTREKRASQISQFDSSVKSDEDYIKLLDIMKRPDNIKYLKIDTSQPIDSYLNTAIAYINMYK